MRNPVPEANLPIAMSVLCRSCATYFTMPAEDYPSASWPRCSKCIAYANGVNGGRKVEVPKDAGELNEWNG